MSDSASKCPNCWHVHGESSDPQGECAGCGSPRLAEPMAPLQLARAKQREMREAGVKLVQLDPVAKAAKNPASRALAIAAMCYQCMGCGADSGWKWQIANCTARGCALYPHRPHRRLEGADAPVSMLGN